MGEQVEALDEMMRDAGTELTHVVSLRVSDATLENRMKSRYAKSLEDPVKNGPVRTDDKTEVTRKKRVKGFHDYSEPMIKHYKSVNLLKEVDGDQGIEDVRRAIA